MSSTIKGDEGSGLREETEEMEILRARGFNSNFITLRGFTSYGYRDRSRDVLSAVDIWDLELRIIPKDKKFRNSVLYDYKQDRIPVLGSNGQSMLVDKDSHVYFDVELLYLPIRLVGKRFHHVLESELALFEEESRDEGVYWLGEVTGSTPVRELLDKVSPNMLDACHIFQEDHALNEKSAINNSPYNLENVEVFFKPIPQCNKWHCPLCLQVQKFLTAHNAAAKKAPGWFLVGLRFDHPESVKFDHLKGLEPLIKQFELLSRVMSINQTIWDSWDQLDGKLDN